MKFNGSSRMSFDDAVRAADKILRKKNPKLRIITRFMVKRKSRIYAYFCYYYLRWVDDYVDNNANSIEQKKRFLEIQLNLVSSILSRKNVKLNSDEEHFLYYYINFLISKDKLHLVDEIFIMIGTIGQDISRLENDGVFSEDELQKYLNAQAESLFRTVNIFLVPQIESKYKDKFSCTKSLVSFALIRDLIDDLDLGYINISREEISKFTLDTEDLINDKKLKDWYVYKTSQFKAMMIYEEEIIKKFPFKLKLFWFWLFPYCLHKIYRIKLYNYNPLEMKNKKLFKEFWLYTFSAINVFRHFFKIFL